MAATPYAVRERVARWGTTGRPAAGMIHATQREDGFPGGGRLMTRVTHIDETVTIGGGLTVGRIGYGAMQLTGPKVWGEYRDHDKGVALLREVVAAGAPGGGEASSRAGRAGHGARLRAATHSRSWAWTRAKGRRGGLPALPDTAQFVDSPSTTSGVAGSDSR